MTRVMSYFSIWGAALIIAGYFALYYSTDYYVSKFTADWLALVALSFMAASTTPVAWRAFKNGIKTDRDKFIFSYWLIWTLVLLHRMWIIFLGVTRDGDALSPYYYSPISGLLAITIGIAAGYGGAAPFSGELPLPKREMFIFAMAAGFAGIIAGIAIGVFLIAGWAY